MGQSNGAGGSTAICYNSNVLNEGVGRIYRPTIAGNGYDESIDKNADQLGEWLQHESGSGSDILEA